MSEKRQALIVALVDVIEAAPASQRVAFADALDDYVAGYPRNGHQGSRSPLLRDLMRAFDEAVSGPKECPPGREPTQPPCAHPSWHRAKSIPKPNP